MCRDGPEKIYNTIAITSNNMGYFVIIAINGAAECNQYYKYYT